MYKNIPTDEIYKKIGEWLDVYHSTDSADKKARMKTYIVANMIPVVKKLAKTIARRATDPIEDLIQAGSIGLLKAIDYYSKDKNDNFRVYAGYLIIGEMKHFLRDKLNTIHVPRHIQELCVRIHNFTKTLTYEELQSLTSDEVASALELPTQVIDYALLADRRSSTLSLDAMFPGGDNSLGYEELIPAKEDNHNNDLELVKKIFDEVIELVPSEERVIIDLYYKQDMNQREIAEALQISKMAVYRKMRKAFNTIAEIIAANSKTDVIKNLELLD